MKSASKTVRPPAVAGRFYPADPSELRRVISSYLESAKSMVVSPPKALIVPHAGYVYSGPIAASAYVHWIKESDIIRRVILMGPSHHMTFQGIAIPRANEFASPLRGVPVDEEAIDRIRSLPQVHVLDEAHALEHSLEVHLPFLQQVLGDPSTGSGQVPSTSLPPSPELLWTGRTSFTIVPLVIGNAADEEIREALEILWGGPETRIVVSSDLSHYHDYETAKKRDRATSDAIEAFRAEKIGFEDACGRLPIQGLLHVAHQHGLRARTVDLRNSGDTAGPRDRVVGYGAYVFTQDH